MDILTDMVLVESEKTATIHTPVELVDIAGLAPKEAAATLGLSPGAARMRLMRTRAQLRKRATTTNHVRSDDND